jgi:hypothetical protein
LLVEPEKYRTTPCHLHEYDGAGSEIRQRSALVPYVSTPYAKALFGVATPITEAASLVGASRYLRLLGRSEGSKYKPVFLGYLDSIRHCIPGTSRFEGVAGGVIPLYVALMLLSGVAAALGSLVLTHRYAFTVGGRIGWTVVGFLFGWVGLVLMLVLEEWPTRVSCPRCGKLRVATRESCEYCGALHATPAPDGTEILEANAPAGCLAL